MKKKYEIGNPSDKCFITGDIETEKEALAVVVAILGNGTYFLIDIDTERALFGGFPGCFAQDWEDEFSKSFNDSITDREVIAQAAEIFESFEYAGERSSMNDIGARAKGNAKNFREFIAKEAVTV